MGADRAGLVVEAALVGEHDVAAGAHLGRLGVTLAQLRQVGLQLGAFGQRRAAVPQAVPRDVVLLHQQERFELVGTHVRDLTSAVRWEAATSAAWSAASYAAP